MKRHIIITLLLLGLASFDASAQWYLFPNRRKSRKDTTTVTTVITPEESIQDSTEMADQFVLDIPSTIRVCLSMPFCSGSAAQQSNFMDFYSGALLAVRSLGNSGLKISLGVFDSSSGAGKARESDLQESDVIIGPVSSADILSSLRSCPEEKFIVSPLDQRAAALVQEHNIIQAAATSEAQVDELVAWIMEDRDANGGTFTVVKEKGADPGENNRYLLEKLKESGVVCDTISYGILEGMKALDSFQSQTDTTVCRRFIIASDNEAFVGDAVRNIAMLKFMGRDVSTYGPSKIKSYESIEQEDLHKIGMKITASYNVDYSSAEVKDFILTYRSLFQAEPNAYAFSGYDVVYYFVKICSEYGRNWPEKTGDFQWKGLQEDFRFEASGCGSVNNATRRITYNSDYSISVH